MKRIYINGEYRDMTQEEIEAIEQSNSQAEDLYWATISYDEAVSIEFRKEYSQDRVEAIINNYLLDQTNPFFIQEMAEMQSYRAQCKAHVKNKKGMK